MHIRKLLAGMLVSAMLTQSICFSAFASETAPAAVPETVVIQAEEAGSPETETEVQVQQPAETESISPETAAESAETIAEEPETAESEAPVQTETAETEETIPAELTQTSVSETAETTEAAEAAEIEANAETAETAESAETAETTETAESAETETDEEAVLLDAVTPKAATNFKATPGDTFVTLSWKKGADATGYRIRMYDATSKSYTWVTATQRTQYRITGLKPQHTYKFQLLAWYVSGGQYTFGESTSWITAKTVLFTPGTPAQLQATDGSTSIKLSWKASSYAQKYRVQMYDASARKYSWCAYTTSTSVTVSGLTNNRTYKFRVQAYRNAADTYTYSGYTSWVTAKTSLIVPDAPTGLTARSGDRSVTLSWTAGAYAHKYLVRVYDCVSKKSYWGTSTAATSATITGLENNHSYKFRVQAYRYNSSTDSYTYSSYTPWVTVAVTPLAGTKAIGWNNSVILQWPKVAGATQYKIYSVNTSTGSRTWVRSLGSTYQEFRLNGLKNGTTYAYRIYAYKNGSIYAYSSVVRATAAEPRVKYVSTALKYLGATEGSALHKEIIDLYNTQNPVPAGYKMTYTAPWCAAFTTAMAIKANVIRMIPGECSCTRQIALWKQLGYYVAGRSYTPSVGDLVYYSWTKNSYSPDHVGIVSKVSGSTLYVVEGNKSNSVSERVINDYKHYGYIIGYGKPNGN